MKRESRVGYKHVPGSTCMEDQSLLLSSDLIETEGLSLSESRSKPEEQDLAEEDSFSEN
jgi:hypothetical protein